MDVYALIKCLYKLITVVASSVTYLVNTTYLPVSTGIVYFCTCVSVPLKITLSWVNKTCKFVDLIFECYFFVLSKEKMSTSKSYHTVIKLICVLKLCDVWRKEQIHTFGISVPFLIHFTLIIYFFPLFYCFLASSPTC